MDPKVFENISKKIVKAIYDVPTDNVEEMVVKGTIINAVLKMTDSEQILNDDLRVLDLYASNGKNLKK